LCATLAADTKQPNAIGDSHWFKVSQLQITAGAAQIQIPGIPLVTDFKLD